MKRATEKAMREVYRLRDIYAAKGDIKGVNWCGEQLKKLEQTPKTEDEDEDG